MPTPMMFTGIDRTTGRARPDRAAVMPSVLLETRAPQYGAQLRGMVAAAVRAVLTVPIELQHLSAAAPADAHPMDAVHNCAECGRRVSHLWATCHCGEKLCLADLCMAQHTESCKAVTQ